MLVQSGCIRFSICSLFFRQFYGLFVLFITFICKFKIYTVYLRHIKCKNENNNGSKKWHDNKCSSV